MAVLLSLLKIIYYPGLSCSDAIHLWQFLAYDSYKGVKNDIVLEWAWKDVLVLFFRDFIACVVQSLIGKADL